MQRLITEVYSAGMKTWSHHELQSFKFVASIKTPFRKQSNQKQFTLATLWRCRRSIKTIVEVTSLKNSHLIASVLICIRCESSHEKFVGRAPHWLFLLYTVVTQFKCIFKGAILCLDTYCNCLLTNDAVKIFQKLKALFESFCDLPAFSNARLIQRSQEC